MSEDIKYLDELIELGKHIKDWKKVGYESFDGSFKDITIHIKRNFGNNNYRIWGEINNYGETELYFLQNNNIEFEEVKELHENIIKKHKEKAKDKLKDLVKEIKLEPKFKED